MKKITQEELDLILEKHKLWLEGKEGGERADLSNANLSGANLFNVNLRGANLRGANLRSARLFSANLFGAILSGADLFCAELTGAILSNADLYGANLSSTILSGADLSHANLSYANLRGTNLCGANLYGIYLQGASTQNIEGISIYSVDNIGTFNGKATYIPKHDIVYAGCWMGTLDEFLDKGLEMNKNESDQKLIDLTYQLFLAGQEKYQKSLNEGE